MARYSRRVNQHTKVRSKDIHNKFKEAPNKFHFEADPKYKHLYDGMSEEFWRGYNNPRKANCYIEAATDLRRQQRNLLKPAFVYTKEIEQYLNDPYFRTCPVHPANTEVFNLSYKGAPPKIKEQAYQNSASFKKKMT